MIKPSRFGEVLKEWYAIHKRTLPWVCESDPYKIWLSEIILQQTTVQQGIPYYNKFIKKYPNIATLSKAQINIILKDWEGLGYYSRAHNLHKTAKIIYHEYNGVFPNTYSELIKLPGIGPYTAAAISSFAFGTKIPAIDGNVFRILSRVLYLTEPIGTIVLKDTIADYLSQVLVTQDAKLINQSLMDFGAIQCTPKKPLCPECPLKENCIAYQKNTAEFLPIKKIRPVKKERKLVFLEIVSKLNIDKVILEKRDSKKDIWYGLYQYPLIEIKIEEQSPTENEIKTKLLDMGINERFTILHDTNKWHTQLLTHQKIIAKTVKVTVDNEINRIISPYYLVERKKLSNFAFPKIIAELIHQ